MRVVYDTLKYDPKTRSLSETSSSKRKVTGAININTGREVDTNEYIDNTQEAHEQYHRDHTYKYDAQNGYVSRTRAGQLSAQRQAEREAEDARRSAERNAIRSTDAYQSSARERFASRTSSDSADAHSARREYESATQAYDSARKRLQEARDSAAHHDVVRGLEDELNSAKQRLTRASRAHMEYYNPPKPSQTAKPFYVDGMGWVDAYEAQAAQREGREVKYAGRDAWGTTAGQEPLADVLETLNEQSIERQQRAYQRRTQAAQEEAKRQLRDNYRSVGNAQRYQPEFTGGLESDIELAKQAEYTRLALRRAESFEHETEQNDRSSEYETPKALLRFGRLNRGQEIANNAQHGMTVDKTPLLNDTEQRTILSLAAQERWDDVEEYYDAIAPQLSQRRFDAETRAIGNASRAAQIAYGVVGSATTAPGAYLQNLSSIAHENMTGEYRPVDLNSGAVGTLRTAQYAQQQSLDDLPAWAQTLGGVGYSVAQNVAALPLGPAGAAIWLGASAAGASTAEALESGATRREALARGTAAGLIETATEKLGLDNLFRVASGSGKSGLKTFLNNVTKQMGTEGIEELVSEYANTVFELVQMGEHSSYHDRIRKLITSGMSEADATATANYEFFLKNPAMAALSGALAGAIMGTGSNVVGQINRTQANRDAAANGDALISAAMKLDRASDSYQIADSIRRDKNYGKKIPDSQYGELATALEQDGVSVASAVEAAQVEAYQALLNQTESEVITAETQQITEETPDAPSFDRNRVAEITNQMYHDIASEYGVEVNDSPVVVQSLTNLAEVTEVHGTNLNTPEVEDAARRAAEAVHNAYTIAFGAQDGYEIHLADDGLSTARDTVRNATVSISQTLASENPELYESALRSLNVSENAIPVGMLYDTLRDTSPDYFNANSEAAQLAEIVDIMQSDSTMLDYSSLPEGSDADIRAEAPTRELINNVLNADFLRETSRESVYEDGGVTLPPEQNVPQNASQSNHGAMAYEAGRAYSKQDIMRTVVSTAAQSGVAANVALNVSNVAAQVGVKTEFQQLGNSAENGYYDSSRGVVVINSDYVNQDTETASVKAALYVFSHELCHHLQQTKSYGQLVTVVRRSPLMQLMLDEMSAELGESVSYADVVYSTQQEYAEYGVELTYQQAEQEVIADFVAEHYLSNPDQYRHLSNMDLDLAHKILAWMQDILNRLHIMSAGFSEVQQAHAVLAAAIAEQAESDAPVAQDSSLSVGSGSQKERMKANIQKYGTLRPTGRVEHMDGSNRKTGTWQAPAQTTDETRTRRGLQSVANAPAVMRRDREAAKAMVEGIGQYEPYSNKRTLSDARAKRAKYSTYDQAVGGFLEESENARIKDAHILVAFGQQLLIEGSNQKQNIDSIRQVTAALAILETDLGRGTQAAAILQKLSPEGQLVAVRRIQDKVNKIVDKNVSRKRKQKDQVTSEDAEQTAKDAEDTATDVRKVVDAIQSGRPGTEIDSMIDDAIAKLDSKRKTRGEDASSGSTSNLSDDQASAAAGKKADELMNKRKKIEDRRKELESQEAKNAATKAELDQIRAELSEVNKEIRTARADESRYIAEGMRKLELIEKRREELLAQIAKRDATKAELDQIRAELSEVNKEIRAAQKQAERAQAQYEKLVEELKNLKATDPANKFREATRVWQEAKDIAKRAKEFADFVRKHSERGVVIPEELLDEFLTATTEAERESARNKIILSFAEQMPGTPAEKVSSWRYFAMLANPKTHLRNLFGNVAMYGARSVRDALAIGGENLFLRDQAKRSRSFVTRKTHGDLFAAAEDVFRSHQKDIAGTPRYGLDEQVSEHRRIFGGNKPLDQFETFRQWTAGMLEKEDIIFLKPAFVQSWSGFVNARHWSPDTMTAEQHEQALDFAKTEAQKATFKQYSALAESLQAFKRRNKTAGFLLDAILPFTKTPINILKTSVDFSPLGFAKIIAKSVQNLRGGEYAPSEIITDFASALTGTGIAVLGYAFAASGLVTGAKDDDPERKEALDEAGGAQEYAIRIGDVSLTIDWIAPAVVPFMIGVELYNAISGNITDEDAVSVLTRVLDTVGRAADPIFEMSMLDSVMSVFNSYSDSSSQKASDIAFSIVESYVGQFLPTLLMQTARVIDPVTRSTYSSQDSILTKSVERAGKRILSKIPFASMLLEPVIDRTGEPTPRISDNILWRAVAMYISPGNIAFDDLTDTDDELLRLYEITGSTDVLPKTNRKSIELDGEKYHFTPEEYTLYATINGQVAYGRLSELMASAEYADMDDMDKADAVAQIINDAQTEADATILDGRGVFHYKRQSTKAEKAAHIRDSNLSADDKIAKFRTLMTESQNESLDSLASAGWNELDLLDCYAKYAEIDKMDMTASEKRSELAKYITDSAHLNYLTPSHAAMFIDSFGYSSGFKATQTTYERLLFDGVSTKSADSISTALEALSPADDNSEVSYSQKLTAIGDSESSDAEKWDAMETLFASGTGATAENRRAEYDAMRNAGVTASQYADIYKAFDNISDLGDANHDNDEWEGENYHKTKYIVESGLPAAQAKAVYKEMIATGNTMEKLESLESAGIGFDIIVRYKYETALLDSKDSSGKSVSGLKKQRVMNVINSLPITAKQKDELYLSEGYSAKTIDDAPWR